MVRGLNYGYKQNTGEKLKSFKDLDIELGGFNVLIGRNASGKSNFVQIFKFLRDVVSHGLKNAISIQGGIEYLRNVNIGPGDEFSLEVTSDAEMKFSFGAKKEGIRLETSEIVYKFNIEFNNKGNGFRITEDKLTIGCDLTRLVKENETIEEKEGLGKGEIDISNVNGSIETNYNVPEAEKVEEYAGYFISPRFLAAEPLEPGTVLLESLISPIMFGINTIFESIAVYNFEPRGPKEGVRITGRMELDEDGKNLAIVLNSIKEDRDKERKFSNLLRDVLPFVEDFDVKTYADKSLLFELREKYAPDFYFPACFVSDGTINIAALIIALYFEEKPLIVIEEPERNIHPYLISKVVDMMKDASQKRQVVVTTHNPEIVRYADLENILLISRDKQGFSNISRPGEKEEVKTFLENEIGIADLYVKDLLGA